MAGGRPKRYAKYEELVADVAERPTKRPLYHDGIGVYPGARGNTAWVKIHLRNGTTFRGKTYPTGSALEIKLGKLSSWGWKELEQKRDEYQGKADQGKPLEEKKAPLFREWANDWLERAKPRLRSYPIVRAHINEHLLPDFGNKSLDAITVGEVNTWMSKKLKSQKPATVKRERDTLQAVLNDAMHQGLVTSNPCKHANAIRGIVGRQRFLRGDELVKLIQTADNVGAWLTDIILWAVHSGMRKSDILSLNWQDISAFDNGRVYATITKSKTDQSRDVLCTRTMCEILERQRTRKKSDNDSIFPVSRMTLRRNWEKARAAAGLRDVTMHDLRRTHSTHAVAAGTDLRTVADRIGHGDLTMLHKHYAAVVGSAAVDAAEKFQEVYDRLASKSS